MSTLHKPCIHKHTRTHTHRHTNTHTDTHQTEAFNPWISVRLCICVYSAACMCCAYDGGLGFFLAMCWAERRFKALGFLFFFLCCRSASACAPPMTSISSVSDRDTHTHTHTHTERTSLNHTKTHTYRQKQILGCSIKNQGERGDSSVIVGSHEKTVWMCCSNIFVHVSSFAINLNFLGFAAWRTEQEGVWQPARKWGKTRRRRERMSKPINNEPDETASGTLVWRQERVTEA